MVPLPQTFPATRDALQRVAVHVLARRRHAATGRIGLRPTPGGFGTPAFGTEVEVLRVSGGVLLHERGGSTRVLALAGRSLGDLARFVGVDLTAEFSAGASTPPVGDPDAALDIDPVAAAALGGWYGLGAAALDAVLAEVGPAAQPSVTQLWPEHFDLAFDLAWGPDPATQRVNVGASPGDTFSADPYLYVGPWGPQRPGAGYWNAPFGATLTLGDLGAAADPQAAATAFLLEGVDRLR